MAATKCVAILVGALALCPRFTLQTAYLWRSDDGSFTGKAIDARGFHDVTAPPLVTIAVRHAEYGVSRDARSTMNASCQAVYFRDKSVYEEVCHLQPTLAQIKQMCLSLQIHSCGTAEEDDCSTVMEQQGIEAKLPTCNPLTDTVYEQDCNTVTTAVDEQDCNIDETVTEKQCHTVDEEVIENTNAARCGMNHVRFCKPCGAVAPCPLQGKCVRMIPGSFQSKSVKTCRRSFQGKSVRIFPSSSKHQCAGGSSEIRSKGRMQYCVRHVGPKTAMSGRAQVRFDA